MSTATGRLAEDTAAAYLKRQGHKILARNWRTRLCEIDIISKRKNTTYFVEVKYRSSAGQGDGLEYVHSGKLKQMHFAAEVWLAANTPTGEYRLAAVSLTGSPPVVETWLDDL